MIRKWNNRHAWPKCLWSSACVLLTACGLFFTPLLVDGSHPGKGGRPLETAMTGDAEVPGPGHPDAVGSVLLRLNPGQEEVCFFIEFEGIDPEDEHDWIRAGHIHVGAADVAGPVVVNFGVVGRVPVDEEGRGYIVGCVTASRELIRDIIQNPEDYYVNLHSANFPGGAIRGQLSK